MENIFQVEGQNPLNGFWSLIDKYETGYFDYPTKFFFGLFKCIDKKPMYTQAQLRELAQNRANKARDEKGYCSIRIAEYYYQDYEDANGEYVLRQIVWRDGQWL